MVDKITGPMELNDVTISGNFYAPAGSIDNTAFSTSSTKRLAATKADHQKHITWRVGDGFASAVAVTDEIIHIAQGAGTIIAAYVRNEAAPTGGDKDYTVDILKAVDASGTYATILSSAIASPADNTVGSGTLSTTTFAQYDSFKLDINATGSTGTNGVGVTVCLILNEAPS